MGQRIAAADRIFTLFRGIRVVGYMVLKLRR
jgi:hypothetical protein